MGVLGDYVSYINTVDDDKSGPKWNAPMKEVVCSPGELFKQKLGDHWVEDVV